MQPPQALNGRTALVTGASAGIGAATARALTRAGARCVLAARRRERLQELADELDGAEVLPLDVRDAAAVDDALASRVFDIVVPNAGLAYGVEPIHEGDPAEWSEMIDTNVKGVLHVLRFTLPAMLEQGRGEIVLIGSVAGFQVYPGGNVYCATKHAVRAIYEALRLETNGRGLRITTIDPGMVETDFSVGRMRGDVEKAARIYQGMTPLTADDVADAVLYAVTRPPHVDVGQVTLWAAAQASTTVVARDPKGT